MFSIQQKWQDMQTNKPKNLKKNEHVIYTQEKGKQWKLPLKESRKIEGLADKLFKTSYCAMFKEQKKSMLKESEDGTMTMSHQGKSQGLRV
jgi:hypothetical protein